MNMPVWKVHVKLPSGELGETEFVGTLAELAAEEKDDMPIMVVRRVVGVVAVPKGGAEAKVGDRARGADSVSIEKR
jgi:hypothetical protein